MNDALKRIEAKYNGNEHVLSPRSDVVKLARALQIARLAFVSIGAIADAKYAERTLEEVAGGER